MREIQTNNMLSLLTVLLLLQVLFLSFAMAWVQQQANNMTGLSFQLVALPPGAGNGTSYSTEQLHLPVSTSARYAYGVFVSLGTGEGTKLKVLALDTAASTSWVMCEPCHPPMVQVGHLFSPAASPTFNSVHGNDAVCVAPYVRAPHGCSFRYPLAHGGAVTGYLSRDTFHLRTGARGAAMVSVPRVVFGCAHSVEGFRNDGTLGGVLSLSRSPLSLLTQLGARAGGRFSYCLAKPTPQNPHGFLRLGADVPIPLPAPLTQTTHLGVPGYHLSLVGISLGSERLRIKRSVFVGNHPGEGGCIVNPAARMTEIAHAAYAVVERAVVAHMAKLGSDRVAGPEPGIYFDQMYKSVKERLPGMTFHFEDGAELRVRAEHVFELHGMTGRFMVVSRGDHRTVIGAKQQVNTRFTFDVAAGTLQFTPDDCSSDV